MITSYGLNWSRLLITAPIDRVAVAKAERARNRLDSCFVYVNRVDCLDVKLYSADTVASIWT